MVSVEGWVKAPWGMENELKFIVSYWNGALLSFYGQYNITVNDFSVGGLQWTKQFQWCTCKSRLIFTREFQTAISRLLFIKFFIQNLSLESVSQYEGLVLWLLCLRWTVIWKHSFKQVFPYGLVIPMKAYQKDIAREVLTRITGNNREPLRIFWEFKGQYYSLLVPSIDFRAGLWRIFNILTRNSMFSESTELIKLCTKHITWVLETFREKHLRTSFTLKSFNSYNWILNHTPDSLKFEC